MSGKTTCGDLPPHSSSTGFPFERPASCMILRPVTVDPVNDIKSTSGCSASALPTIEPSPGTTFSTPGGSPASIASSANLSAELDAISDGLSTTVLPAASAGANLSTALTDGKFQGVIAPTTPRGS